MSLRLVHCPYCRKRFNLTGVEPGTRRRCTWCTAVLIVPGAQVPPDPRAFSLRPWALPAGAALAAGLALAILLPALFAPSAPSPSIPSAAVAPVLPPAPPPAESSGTSAIIVGEDRVRQAIFDEFGTDFLINDTVRPYLVGFEKSPRYIGWEWSAEYGRQLETLHAAFRGEFGDTLGLPPVDEPLVVIVLSSRESFDRYCERTEKRRLSAPIKGIYQYTLRRVVLYHGDEAPWVVLFHEGAHQLVHHYTRRSGAAVRDPGTYWFQEGLGTYFEGFRRRGDGQIDIDPSVNRHRLPALKQALQEGRQDWVSLGVLVGMTVDDFWEWWERGRAADPEGTTRKAQLYYAESWAFVYFLRQKGGNLRKTFDDYLRAEISGQGRPGAFGRKELFEKILRENAGVELAAIEDEFVEYIQGLR